MAKGKTKEGKLHKVKAISDEDHQKQDHQKKRAKTDRKLDEEDKKQSSAKVKLKHCDIEGKCLDEKCSTNEWKKSRKKREQSTLESLESSKVMKEDKHCKEKERSHDAKLPTTTEEFTSFYKDSNVKEHSDLISSQKKKKREEVKDNHSEKVQACDEMEQSIRKHRKKVKTAKHEVDKRGKKRTSEEKTLNTLDQEIYDERVLEIASGIDNVDSSKKKRKRKAETESMFDTGNNNDNEILGFDHGEVDKESVTVKKKKKKKSKGQPEQESKPAVHPGLDYLHTWYTDRQNWNFKKVRQVWLLQKMFDQEQVGKVCRANSVHCLFGFRRAHF